MNIEEQTIAADKVTDALLNFIFNANNKKLNGDGKGCYISSINIAYFSTETRLTVQFGSTGTSVTSFTCTSIKY